MRRLRMVSHQPSPRQLKQAVALLGLSAACRKKSPAPRATPIPVPAIVPPSPAAAVTAP